MPTVAQSQDAAHDAGALRNSRSAGFVVSDASFLPTTRQMALSVGSELRLYITPYFVGQRARPICRFPYIGPEVARRSVPASLRACGSRKQTLNEFTRVGLRHLGVRRFDYELLWAKNVRFDRAVARLVKANQRGVICQCGAALETFKKSRSLGVTTILDYPIARHELGRSVLEQEADAHPEFADTVTGRSTLTPRDPELERMRLELQEADRIVVGSQFAAESFHNVVDADRMVVIPYGVDTKLFSPPQRVSSHGRLRVLFAGQLTLRKGLPYILDAVKTLGPRQARLTLVGAVVGSGQWMKTRRGEFHHLGVCRPSEMPAVYREADVLVLPSLVEGSAIVVYEAMAMGLPVIVTPNVGADLVRHGIDGFVVPARSAEAIVPHLETLIDEPNLRSEMGCAARRRVLSFDWLTFREAFRNFCLAASEAAHA